jgi:hypothetical protein
MTTPYTEVADAPGAWTRQLWPSGPVPVEQVRHALVGLARTFPVGAFLPGTGDEPVVEVVLYREPSRTYGTPSAAECDDAVSALAAATGWVPTPPAPVTGVLACLGLREGYDPAATAHAPREVADQFITAGAAGTLCRAGRLVSARLVNDAIRWYEEEGVLVHTQGRFLRVVDATALACGQLRYVVTDLDGQRTYALQRAEAASAA